MEELEPTRFPEPEPEPEEQASIKVEIEEDGEMMHRFRMPTCWMRSRTDEVVRLKIEIHNRMKRERLYSPFGSQWPLFCGRKRKRYPSRLDR